jgi:hypothetical protein
MDQPEFPMGTAPRVEEDSSLEEQIQSLRSLTTVLLFAMLCMGTGMSLFLYRHMTQVNVQLTEGRRYLADYQTNAFPRLHYLVASFQLFAKTNQDFAPILAKYGLLQTNPTGSASAQAPAPR